METTDILFALLRHAVCGEELNEQTIAACTPEKLEEVYALAKKHDLAHLVAYAVEGLQIPACEVTDKLKKAKMKAIYRYARMEYELERICRVLEQAEIPFIPLKGSVLRKYYPEPWMRTSGDIDVLVKETDFQRAVVALNAQNWKTEGPVQYQNICLRAPSGVLLELHFNIRVKMAAADIVMDMVWHRSEPTEGKQYMYRQTDAFFMCHQLAHMAKHVLVGGCGIRPFLDTWILNHRMTYDEMELHQLCEDAKLAGFYRQAAVLAEVWFGKGVHTSVSEKLEQYILDGGVYGSMSNKVALAQARIGGKFKNFWNRMFVPYGEMKQMYPVLEKWRWLLPVYHVVRWCQVIASGRMKKAVKEFQLNQNSSAEDIQNTKTFMKEIGLYQEVNSGD